MSHTEYRNRHHRSDVNHYGELMAALVELETGMYGLAAGTTLQVALESLESSIRHLENAVVPVFVFKLDCVIARGYWTLDAIIMPTFTVDAWLAAANVFSLSTDAVILKQATTSTTLDAIVESTQLASFVADAIAMATASSTFTADAWVTTGGMWFTVDAYITSGETSWTSGGTLGDMTLGDDTLGGGYGVSTRSGSFTADAYIVTTESAESTLGDMTLGDNTTGG